MKTKYFFPILFLLFISCHSNSKSETFEEMVDVTEAGTNYNYDQTAKVASEENIEPNTSSYEEKSTTPQKLIKTAKLVFETEELTQSRKNITQDLKKYGAYISNESSSDHSYRSTQYLTIKVPVKQFDNLLQTIGQGVKQFDIKEIDVSDVSEEYYDVIARIQAQKKLEERLYEILKVAETVDELLEVESKLGDVRMKIESMQGRLKFLENKTNLSTINIEYYITKDYHPKPEKNRFLKGLINGWNGLVNFLVGIVNIWPIILVICAIVFFIRRVIKKRKTKS